MQFSASSSLTRQQGSVTKHLLVWAFAAVLITVFFNVITDKEKPLEQVATPPFDEGLLSCNELLDASPSDAFTTCENLAKEGWPKAQRKIAWAYTQKGEFQDYGKAYQWISRLARDDRGSELMKYILLRIFADNEKDKNFGEEGIRRLANVNYAPAAAYLGIMYKLNENYLDKTSNALWLLERAHNQNPNVLNAYQLAIIYANGLGVERNIEKAKRFLLEYASYDYPVTTNNVAWFLATIDDNPFTEPSVAVELAETVTQDENYAQNHVYIDTLAATYAANGEFDKAVEQQQAALAKLKSAAAEDENSDQSKLIEEYEERLALYMDSNKAVTETLKREYESFFKGVKVFIEQQLINQLDIYIEKPEPPRAEQ